jgi:hypothetical protein
MNYAFLKEDPVVFKLQCQHARILILGGLGFVGKNFLLMIDELELFSQIVIVDISLPILSNFDDPL